MYILYMHYYNHTLYITYTCSLISYICMCVYAHMHVLYILSYIPSFDVASL